MLAPLGAAASLHGLAKSLGDDQPQDLRIGSTGRVGGLASGTVAEPRMTVRWVPTPADRGAAGRGDVAQLLLSFSRLE